MNDPTFPVDAGWFWHRVMIDSPDGCWLWTGKCDQAGYGRLEIRGCGTYRSTGAHRVAYERFHGPIPDGLAIDHLCRVKRCVNPSHMEPVTATENTRRHYVAEGHAALPPDPELVNMYVAGMSVNQIAAAAGGSGGTVARRLKAAGVAMRPRGRPKGYRLTKH